MFTDVRHYVQGTVLSHGHGIAAGLPLWLASTDLTVQERQESLVPQGSHGQSE